MYLEEIIATLENKVAPELYNLNLESYGIQYGAQNKEKLIQKTLITLDLSLDAIKFAIKNKINFIISFHGLINAPINIFNTFLINKLYLLSKYPITLYVLNSAFIAAEGGISDMIADALYLKVEKTFDIINIKKYLVPFGRICSVKEYPNNPGPQKLETLIKRTKNLLNNNNIFFIGKLDNILKKICLLFKDLIDICDLEKIIKEDCNCCILWKINHNEALFAKEMGLNIIEVSHYKSIIIAMKRLCTLLSLEYPRDEFVFFDSGDPFNFY